MSFPPEQSNPSFSPMQSSKHPSYFPASHISPKRTFPSPQVLQIDGRPLQTYFGSMRQSFEHPSKSIVFPSSHSVSNRMMLSPHTGLQMSFVVLFPPSQTHSGRLPIQVELQPYVLFDPSSHASFTSQIPFPHNLHS